MKKLILATLCLVLLCVFVTVPTKADTAPVITLHPQSPNFPEESVASYTVKATGTNLHAYWYMEYAGKTYEISDTTNGTEPWEAYAGETYGAAQEELRSGVWWRTDTMMLSAKRPISASAIPAIHPRSCPFPPR